MSNGRKWTKEEDFLITKLYQEIGAEELQKDLNRTVGAIKKRAHTIGVSKKNKKPWTDEEIEYLEETYCLGVDIEDIARKLGRTKISIAQKAYYLMLKRPKAWLECEDEYLIEARRKKITYPIIAEKLGRPVGTCSSRFTDLKKRGLI